MIQSVCHVLIRRAMQRIVGEHVGVHEYRIWRSRIEGRRRAIPLDGKILFIFPIQVQGCNKIIKTCESVPQDTLP